MHRSFRGAHRQGRLFGDAVGGRRRVCRAWRVGGEHGLGLVRVDRVRGGVLFRGRVLLEDALVDGGLRARLGRADVLYDVILVARLARENGERVRRRVEICDTRTRTALAPRSGGDFGAEKTTTLMLPSSADMMPTFTAVLFSDMLLIEFTRTCEGAVDGGCVIFAGVCSNKAN